MLHGEGRLRSAIAAKRPADRRVGEHRRDLDVGVGHGVGAEELAGDPRGLSACGSDTRPVDHTAHPETRDVSFVGDTELEIDAVG